MCNDVIIASHIIVVGVHTQQTLASMILLVVEMVTLCSVVLQYYPL